VPVTDPTTERGRLLSLVADHILVSGVSSLTLRGLSRAVGSNNRMLIYYFGTKEQMISLGLVEVYTRFPRLRGALGGLIGDGPLEERLHRVWLDVSAPENLPFLRLFFEGFGLAAHQPDRYQPLLKNWGTDWVLQVASAIEAEGVEGGAAHALAIEVIALWRGLQFALLSGTPPDELNQANEAAVRSVSARVAAAQVSHTA
jgi:AcrR family transcriptional regulator